MKKMLRGRDSQLGLLRDELATLDNEGRGGVMVVTGSGGVGKTSLLRAAEHVATSRTRVLYGTADLSTRSVPFAALVQALGVKAVLADQWTVLREIADRLERVAVAAPLVVALDDLHWADDATLSAVTTLPATLASHPVLWLLAFRTGHLSGAARATLLRLDAMGATRVTLNRLDPEAVLALAGDVLEAQPDKEIAALLERTGGQPFLVVEMLRGLRADGLVLVRDGLAGLASGPSSATVNALGSLFDRLEPGTAELLELAAMLGGRFGVTELATLSGRPPAALLPPLRDALAAGLLVEDGEQLRFRHDLLHEAVAARLPAAVRLALRREAAEVLLRHGAAATDIAALVAEVARPGDADALALLGRAVREIGATAPVVAAPLALRALELTPARDPARADVVLEALDQLVRAGRAATADRLLRESAGLGIDPEREATARLKIGILELQYTPGAVSDQCRRALALPGLTLNTRIRLTALLACVTEMGGGLDDAALIAGHAAKLVRSGADTHFDMVPRALVAYARGEPQRARELAAEAWRLYPGSADDELPLWAPDSWHALLVVAGLDLDAALPLIGDGLKRARDRGTIAMLRVWTMIRCRALWELGRLADAWAEAEAVLDMADSSGELGGGYLNSIAAYMMARIALRTGDTAQLLIARRSVDQLGDAESRSGKAMGAWVAALLGDDFDAEQVDVVRIDLVHATAPRAYADSVDLVRLLLARGRDDDADPVVRRLEAAAAERPGFPFLAGAARHARGLLARDPQALAEALALQAADPRPLILADLLADAGAAHSGRPEAVAMLHRALVAYQECGAQRDAARVRQLLRDNGVRPRATATAADSDWPELTDSETAIARLVADGRTNRQIAEQLFISPHTVNSHLRHIFAKLDIRSRVELVRIAVDRYTRRPSRDPRAEAPDQYPA
jgi:DNA-binding CsgD family transcriptional regulator/ABC-type transport system involved in cytochrome c biogenesis ATPase subunit